MTSRLQCTSSEEHFYSSNVCNIDIHQWYRASIKIESSINVEDSDIINISK